MSKKEEVKKLEEQELTAVREQQGKIQQVVMDLGALEVRKTEVLGVYNTFAKALDVTKKELEDKYGQVNINLQDGSYEKIKEEDKVESK